jgi:hypothetical protein
MEHPNDWLVPTPPRQEELPQQQQQKQEPATTSTTPTIVVEMATVPSNDVVLQID